ncbi:hypothetical protein G6L37_01305 [Agrobacterium rubi]|nr:hypothetical protein [Agrobacterium rubi]NTF24029.1 hypothetical protein [Agrobacterium rubi]
MSQHLFEKHAPAFVAALTSGTSEDTVIASMTTVVALRIAEEIPNWFPEGSDIEAIIREYEDSDSGPLSTVCEEVQTTFDTTDSDAIVDALRSLEQFDLFYDAYDDGDGEDGATLAAAMSLIEESMTELRRVWADTCAARRTL